MKYFLPDAQDLVDPSFDFDKESRSKSRIRQRDDQYAHEVFSDKPFDGMLVSKAIVEGTGAGAGRYSLAQRHRLLRVGVRDFLRLHGGYRDDLPVMGDCGGFSYVKEEKPAYTVDEVIDFYEDLEFDYGISVDHVILGFDERHDELDDAPEEWTKRQELTLELAREFFETHKRNNLFFKPLGVAQGWSPKSYAHSVAELQKIGFRYIAVGGMVPLKTSEIISSLRGIDQVRAKDTKLHLLGLTRLEQLDSFQELGVVSIDSTSPLRQAFKDDRDNYYTPTRTYTAIRIPQVEGNPTLQKKIRAGQVPHDKARRLEKACLKAMKEFDADKRKLDEVVSLLVEYDQLLGGRKDHTEVYRETLEARPWRDCACDICQRLRYHVILFRGAERNRRRGLHNVWTFYRRLQTQLGSSAKPKTSSRQLRLQA